ncbi:unnamed protein product [Sphagnum balticum]
MYGKKFNPYGQFPGKDEGLLYLAREGLKAPLPANWVPYQSRNGEVYYKHRITQEKTYDHPTDVEYKKQYEQQKEKMARKNLKSMGLKASGLMGAAGLGGSVVGGLMQPGLANSSLFGSKMAVSALGVKEEAAKLDVRFEEDL